MTRSPTDPAGRGTWHGPRSRTRTGRSSSSPSRTVQTLPTVHGHVRQRHIFDYTHSPCTREKTAQNAYPGQNACPGQNAYPGRIPDRGVRSKTWRPRQARGRAKRRESSRDPERVGVGTAATVGCSLLVRRELDERQVAAEHAVVVGWVAEHLGDAVLLVEVDAGGLAELVARATGVGAGPDELRLAASVGVPGSDVRPERSGLDLHGNDAVVVDAAGESLGTLADVRDLVLHPLREVETLIPVWTPLASAGLAQVDELLADLGEAAPDERDSRHERG